MWHLLRQKLLFFPQSGIACITSDTPWYCMFCLGVLGSDRSHYWGPVFRLFPCETVKRKIFSKHVVNDPRIARCTKICNTHTPECEHDRKMYMRRASRRTLKWKIGVCNRANGTLLSSESNLQPIELLRTDIMWPIGAVLMTESPLPNRRTEAHFGPLFSRTPQDLPNAITGAMSRFHFRIDTIPVPGFYRVYDLLPVSASWSAAVIATHLWASRPLCIYRGAFCLAIAAHLISAILIVCIPVALIANEVWIDERWRVALMRVAWSWHSLRDSEPHGVIRAVYCGRMLRRCRLGSDLILSSLSDWVGEEITRI